MRSGNQQAHRFHSYSQQERRTVNDGSDGNMRGGNRQAGGNDQYQQPATGGSSNHHADENWLDSTS